MMYVSDSCVQQYPWRALSNEWKPKRLGTTSSENSHPEHLKREEEL
jgi:hypothetical protein